MTGSGEGSQQKIEAAKRSIRTEVVQLLIKQLPSKPQIINSPRRSLTRQETVVVTLPANENTSFSSSKVDQTAGRRGSDPGKK
jgi:hypothetical protein